MKKEPVSGDVASEVVSTLMLTHLANLLSPEDTIKVASGLLYRFHRAAREQGVNVDALHVGAGNRLHLAIPDVESLPSLFLIVMACGILGWVQGKWEEGEEVNRWHA